MNEADFVAHLTKYIGETVTIFTTSGGESGRGLTGILISVNNYYVRLITQIGIAPGCALGNCCDGDQREGTGTGFDNYNAGQNVAGIGNDFDDQFVDQCLSNVGGANTNRFNCRGNTVGSVTDIPIDRIASFVHNAV